MKKTDTLFEAINTAHIKNNAITTSKLNDGRFLLAGAVAYGK